MKIDSSSGKGNFKIEKNGKELLELKYQNWFSSRAITNFEGQKIEIVSKNIWFSKFDIYKDNVDKGDIIFNWKGNIIIRVLDKENKELSFLLKSKGFWKQYFEMTDEKGNIIFILRTSMSWEKMGYNYKIENISNLYDEKLITELLIYSGFGANLYMIMIAAAAGGAS